MDEFLDVICEDPRWQAAGLPDLALPAVTAALAEVGLPLAGFSLCVMGCDDGRIAALNGDFRGKASATNVLSWPAQERGAKVAGKAPRPPRPGPAEDPTELGDIAIAYETCTAEAVAAGKPFSEHVSHLIIHGVLHLLGYDHIRDADGDLMEGIETRAMARLGLPDPYLDPDMTSPQDILDKDQWAVAKT